MRILMSGSSGFVGRALAGSLRRRGDDVWSLVRRAPREGAKEIEWLAPDPPRDPAALEGFDALVHLAGESIASGPWTRARRERLRSSRVDTTRGLALAAAGLERPPAVLLCASAVGFYGDTGDRAVDETSGAGDGFLADLVGEWEAAAEPARAAGLRTVHGRFGLVLAPEGAPLATMLPAFRLGLGARLGDGRQWMSWVSRRDLVAAIEFLLESRGVSGPVNVVAGTTRNADFTRTLARALRRPAPFVAPAFLLRLLAGDLAREALLAGQRVVSRRLTEAGFTFRDDDLAAFLTSRLADAD